MEVEDPTDANQMKLCFDAAEDQEGHKEAIGRGYTDDNTLAVVPEEPPATPGTPKESEDAGAGSTETQKGFPRVEEEPEKEEE